MKNKLPLYLVIILLGISALALSWRRAYNPLIKNTATLNFPSTNSLESNDLTISVTGAVDGNVVSVGIPNASVNTGCSYFAWVSATNTVTVRFYNGTISPVDPASGVFSVIVVKF